MVRDCVEGLYVVDRRMEESEDDYNERLVVAAVQYFNEHFSVGKTIAEVTNRTLVSIRCW